MHTLRRLNIFSRIFLAALLPAAAGLKVACAAALQGYSLSISETGNDALDEAIADTSLLETLHDSPPANILALADRARSDIGRIETALGSFGYYHPLITITLAGRPISQNDALAALADDAPEKPEIVVQIDKGPLYRLRHIRVTGPLPSGYDSQLELRPGQPAIAADILAAGTRTEQRLREAGYAYAKISPPDALADDSAAAIDVRFTADSGRRAKFGAVRFSGLEKTDEAFAARIFAVSAGEDYSPAQIDRGRNDLLALGVFNEVSVRQNETPDSDGNAPLDIRVSERKRRSVAFAANYSTDLGTALSASWTHRNLLGEAERLVLSAAATGLGGKATTGIGYVFSAQFIKPEFLSPGQHLELSFSAVKQKLDAYDQTAETVGGYLQRPLGRNWSGRAGLAVTFDRVTQAGSTRDYQLFTLPASLSYDSTGLGNSSLSDPTRGLRAALSATPAVTLGSKQLVFATLQASASQYFDISGDGHSVLALRGLLGSVEGASSLDLPPDQRLYAGGSGTIRGYRYQSVGPGFANGDPAGATSVDAASLEWRQRIWGNFGVASFFDLGQAADTSLPFSGKVHYGTGGGLRYYTPIGAVRLDVAVPLTKTTGKDNFQVYISIGQAF